MNTLLMADILADSLKPTIVSGEMSLMNGNSLAMAMVAARAVLPLPDGPWIKTLTNGVRELFRTCSTNNWPSFNIRYTIEIEVIMKENNKMHHNGYNNNCKIDPYIDNWRVVDDAIQNTSLHFILRHPK